MLQYLLKQLDSPILQERFEQRLGEYTTFWTSLERLCRHLVGYEEDNVGSGSRQSERFVMTSLSKPFWA